MRYVHPLRLYLVVSLIFFFLISLSVDSSVQVGSADFGRGMLEGFFDLDSLDNDTSELIISIIMIFYFFNNVITFLD